MTADVFDGVYAVEVKIPHQLIIEIEELDNNLLAVTSGTGESYELDQDAFAVLTGRDWQDFVKGY